MTTAFPVSSAHPRPQGEHRPAPSRRDISIVTLRQATRDDCARIARLYMVAGHGIAEYIWSRVDAPGLSLLEIGERRFAREGTAFSYQNALVAEKDGSVIGLMLSFPMEPPSNGRRSAADDPVLAPYAELEDYDSLYVSTLAVFHEHQGLGIGTRLLHEASRRARATGLDRLSLICLEKNTKALRLYRRLGFHELARRPIVPHPFFHYREGDALLLACPTDELTP
jgi:ribosomal protein S18 acetylase RimI-like enzyme